MPLLALSATAQNHKVSGVVLDSLTREGEPGAVLQFFRASDRSKPFAFTTSDAEGNFSHTLSGNGDYSLMFSALGRKTVWLDFTLQNGEKDKYLGEILVSDDSQALSDAVVTAQRPLVKMDVDKMSYDVANDVDSKASTVLDMLRKVPMVTVDAQDKISVNGSSSFLVTIDGKPNQMITANASTVFKMMPAAAVKEIEVITNPGVKYDAEGVGGVLNIVINKEIAGGAGAADGYYATLRGNVGNRNKGAGLYLSVQKGKFAMSFDGNAGTNKLWQRVGNSLIYDDGSSFLQDQGMTNRMKFGMSSLNMSYEIDSLNLVSASAGWMTFPSKMNGYEENTQFARGGAADGSYLNNTRQKYHYNSVNASADFQHGWAGRPGQTLIFSYQYSGNPTTSDNRRILSSASGIFDGAAPDSRRVSSEANSLSHTFQVDFTLPLSKEHKISTGLKYIYRHNFSTDDYYTYDGSSFVPAPLLGSQYDYYNNIGALYGEYSGIFGKWSFKAGARYEHTWQKIEYDSADNPDFDTDYGDLVPNASVQYSLGQASNIGLTYNLRLSRPGITYLNPYVNKSNPMFWVQGNSDLDVARTHSVGLVYNYFNPFLMVNISGNFSRTGNGIEQYTYSQDGVNITTYGNIVKSTKTGLSAFVNVNVSSKTRIYANMSAGYADLRSSRLGQSNSGWESNLFAGAQETLPWDLRFSQNLIFSGRSYNLQGYNSGFSGAALSLSKSFLSEKLTFSLSAFSPLNSDGCIRFKMYGGNPGNDGLSTPYKSVVSVKVPVRQVSFGVSWTFGSNSGIKVKKTSRSIEKDDIVGASSSSSGAASDATQTVGL